jgi:hypothetical protein
VVGIILPLNFEDEDDYCYGYGADGKAMMVSGERERGEVVDTLDVEAPSPRDSITALVLVRLEEGCREALGAREYSSK